ncbi:MAG: hypothetical protein WD988_01415 [Candidatus Curtissbacteria bacterium]
MSKKLVIFSIVLIVAAVVFAIFFTAKNTGGKSLGGKTGLCDQVVGEATTISMNDEGFSPSEISIKVCTKVTFKNEGSEARWPASNLHPTHGIYPEFDPLKGIAPGGLWSFVFDRAGAWRFHDHLNPQLVGTINVTQ